MEIIKVKIYKASEISDAFFIYTKMKHIENYKKFENSNIKSKFKQYVENAGYWFKEQFPKNNFFDWEYLFEGGNNITYYFYYKQYTDDDTIDKIFNYLDSENITYIFGNGLHSYTPKNIKNQDMILFNLSWEEMYKYSKLYKSIKNFNL